MDTDSIIRRFYKRFRTEHTTFQTFIQGIVSTANRASYTSLMLSRLMFLYFMQHKGFLNGDTDYLGNHLRTMQGCKSNEDTCLSFYRHFLLPLFHKRLGTYAHSHSLNLDALLGKVPYLNCGLFNIHTLERDHPDIQIADEAFARLFTFFDAYQWQLDERPLCADDEITPDILGYIFEQHINQKQMGAYYTKEDIGEYIAKNTIIPFLFGAAEKKSPAAFEPYGPIWRLLAENPDRYIYETIRRENYLPTETQREFAARRKRYIEVKAKLLASETTSINDLITSNLDIRRFAQDVIEHCDEPGLLQAFYESIEQMTILDPTCGSGAFLFAALKVLEPLYEVCLDRLGQTTPPQGDRKGSPLPYTTESSLLHDYGTSREAVYGRGGACPRPGEDRRGTRRYSIRKSIILNNLYGVDIMQEATEICKLRLSLKLLAQIERVEDLELLPDLDGNIRAGNTLIGFATHEEATRAYLSPRQGALMAPCLGDRYPTPLRSTHAPTDTFPRKDGEPRSGDPCGHQGGGEPIFSQLDHLLAVQYGIDPNDAAAFEHWRSSHQPFHWCLEFDEIMQRGGFDVIIGNPPYAEHSTISSKYTLPSGIYETESCSNLYAFCIERFAALSNPMSVSGLIVPLSIVCTGRMVAVRRILYTAYSHLWFNNYDTIPGTLFSGIVQRNSIIFASRSAGRSESNIHTTRNQKWYASERASLFESVSYIHICSQSANDVVPKVSTPIELNILNKIQAQRCPITSYTQRHSNNTLLYKRRWSYFLLFADNIKSITLPDGSTRQQQDVKTLALQPQLDRYVFIALLNSSLFYFHYSVFSDFRHVNKADFDRFTFDYMKLSATGAHILSTLGRTLMQSYRDNLEWRTCDYIGSIGKCQVPFYRQGTSKPIIDAIDTALAEHYGLTDEELDFIINYDSKYRMGENHVT